MTDISVFSAAHPGFLQISEGFLWEVVHVVHLVVFYYPVLPLANKQKSNLY